VAIDAAGVFWWHSIRLPDGTVTPGEKSEEILGRELTALDLPDLRGRTVLDVGAWDGYFSFAAEAAGASRVVALDHYAWSMDLPAQQAYWRDCRERGETPEPYETVPGLWQPETLPGKRAFDRARELLGSGVEDWVADFMTLDPAELGSFDVVLYLGVLYHMTDPLGALRRLRRATTTLAVVESEAIALPGLEDRALVEFYPGAELNADVGNWWAPTLPALTGLCTAAGFSQTEVKVGPPDEPAHYRAVVHARA
jgi:tRNA (mo5U34)-methyltransferase